MIKQLAYRLWVRFWGVCMTVCTTALGLDMVGDGRPHIQPCKGHDHLFIIYERKIPKQTEENPTT